MRPKFGHLPNQASEIIGGMALELHRIEIGRATTDIDTTADIQDDEIFQKIQEIGRSHSLESWIENPKIALPPNYTSINAKAFNGFNQINGSVLSQKDLVILKVASFFDRADVDDRDYTDIESIIVSGLKFTTDLYKESINFVESTRTVNTDDGIERLNLIKEEFLKLIINE